MELEDTDPTEVAAGLVVRDRDLPMLAAGWLAQGWDGPRLRELAGRSWRDQGEAATLLPLVLAELGSPVAEVDRPWDERPWRGYWHEIRWSVDQMDRTHHPYASAQRVLEVVSDVPDLWEPSRDDELSRLLDAWTADDGDRAAVTDRIRGHLRSLAESDVPPLVEPSTDPET